MEATYKRMQLTPLEKLQSDKLYAKIRSEEAAQRLDNNFTYIQDNTGKFILSGISSYLFPGNKAKKEDNDEDSDSLLPALIKRKPGINDALTIGTTIIPHLWGIAKPVLLTWGIGKMQSLLLDKLFGKKKKK